MSTATQATNVPAPYGEPYTNLDSTHDKGGVPSTKSQSNTNVNGAQATQSQSQSQPQPQHQKSQVSQQPQQSQPPQPQKYQSQAQPQTNGTPKESKSTQNVDGGAAGSEEGAGDKSGSNGAEPEGGYPEQLHAGHVDGVGPEYGKQNHVTIGERMTGVKEQIKGTIKKDPDLKQKGKDRMTGELKRREHDENDEQANAFANAQQDKSEDSTKAAQEETKKPSEARDEREGETAKNLKEEPTQREAGSDTAPHAHPDDKAAYEQAENVKPEGQEQGMTQEEKAGKERAMAGGVGGQ